jgi:hypothetical protein
MRSYLGLIYAVIVFLPALIYVYLLTMSLFVLGAAAWATLILFVELARLSGKPLRNQEAIVILWGSGFVTMLFIPITMLIYALYFRHSPAAQASNLVNVAPTWFAPSADSPVWLTRTLLSQEWLIPISVVVITILLTVASNVCLGFIGSQIYIKEEKLPFPGASAVADGCATLVSRDREKMRILSFATVIAMIFALLVYGIPFISWAYGQPFQPIPIPWVDFNTFVHLYIPGASFGIATDLVTIALGLIVPFGVSIAMVAGAFGFYFIGNSLLVQYHLTEFSVEWRYGLSIALSWQRSLLFAWLSPIIGLAAAAGIVPLMTRPQILVKAFRALGASSSGGPRLWTVLGGFLVAAIGSSVLVSYLVPGFPFPILVLLVAGWSLLFLQIGSRAIGVTALNVDVPSVPGAQPFTSALSPAYFFFKGSGYAGVDIYFAPLAIENSYGGSYWVNFLKSSEVLHTSPTSFMKAVLAAVPLGLVMSLVYVSEFWKIAPIPSAVYPGTLAYWPTFSVLQAAWASGTFSPINVTWLVAAFAVSAVLDVIFRVAGFPISMIAVATGAINPFPVTFAIFLGAVIGKILQLAFGKERWSRYNVTVFVGFLLGEGIIVAVSAGIAIILRGMWILPY